MLHIRIALYGKGGIGKSTLSANLSAAFAQKGKKVLQIGCDPKRDSTRLLLEGRRIQTVLDYIKTAPPSEQSVDDIIHTGYHGVDCVEAGGPEPGVGCAGRGILSAFSLLDRLGCRWEDYDIILYDVLGDVVCGGFAVPLRKGYAETVLVVTSEEYMSLYAANNILRGVKNLDRRKQRKISLAVNRREREGDFPHVYRFAEAAGVPVLTVFPRSNLFPRAEKAGKTLMEAFPDSYEASVFRNLTESITVQTVAELHPLTDEDLERIVMRPEEGGAAVCGTESLDHREAGVSAGAPVAGRAKARAAAGDISKAGGIPKAGSSPKRGEAPRRFLSKSLLAREPLHGCAFTGAVNTLTQISDAATLAHGPRSCAHIGTSTTLSSALGSLRRYGVFIPQQFTPNLLTSEMSEEDIVHGSLDVLQETLEAAVNSQPGAVFVVTTCPAGVIGEDVDSVIDRYRGINGGVPIMRITSDGNIEGDYLQGVINACIEGASSLIDPDIGSAGDCVNVVAEKNIALNADANFARMSRMLKRLGIEVNCRFVRRTDTEGLKHFLKAPYNLLAYSDHLGRLLRRFLTDRYGCRFAENPFPTGLYETERWLREIGKLFSRPGKADEIFDELRKEYREKIDAYRPVLEGRRVMIFTYNHDIDWILETAFDLGMEIIKAGIVDYSQEGEFRTRYSDRFEAEVGYNPDKRKEDILSLRPDLCLSNYQSPGLPEIARYDTVPLCPDTGHLAGLALAERWRRILDAPLVEGWRKDEERLLRNPTLHSGGGI